MMPSNTFTNIHAGMSSTAFNLPAGKYVVQALPVPTKPGEFSGVISLQALQANGRDFGSVGSSTNFQQRGSVALHLDKGTYRFTATRTAATFASVIPAT